MPSNELRRTAASLTLVVLALCSVSQAQAAGSLAATVRELMELDAKAARDKLAPAAVVAAPKREVLALGAVAPDVARNASAIAQAPALPEVRVEAIYGTSSFGVDNRTVEVVVDGRAKSMRRGDVFEGYQLQSVEGACAVLQPMSRRVSAAAGAKSGSTALAEGGKGRRVCLDEATVATSSDNTVIVPPGPGRAMPMPSPVYRPALPGGAPVGVVGVMR